VQPELQEAVVLLEQVVSVLDQEIKVLQGLRDRLEQLVQRVELERQEQ
jgi:hypothetical protein